MTPRAKRKQTKGKLLQQLSALKLENARLKAALKASSRADSKADSRADSKAAGSNSKVDPAAPLPLSSVRRSPAAPSLLLLENDPATCWTITQFLKSTYQVVTAIDGHTGLQLALTQPPDAILCELHLPDMSATTVLQQLQIHACLRDIPVIFLSGDHADPVRMTLLRLGAQDFLTKPFSLEELRVRLERVLSQQQQQQALQQQVFHQEAALELLTEEIDHQLQALLSTEKQFQRAILAAPLPMMLYAEDGEVLQLNQAWTAITGYTLDAIPTIAAWVEKAGGKSRLGNLLERLHCLNGQLVPGEYSITTRQGEEHIWDFYSTNLGQLADGRRLILSTAIDVTERRRTEAALRESEAALQQAKAALEMRVAERTAALARANEQLNHILSNAVAAITRFRVFADRTWEYEYHSAATEVIFGYTPTELIEDKYLWLSRVHADDREVVILPLFEDFFAERTPEVEYRYHHKDGTLRWILTSYKSQWDSATTSWVVTAVNNDISDRKRIEAALQQSEARYRTLVANLPGAVYRCSHGEDWQGMYISDAIAEIAGYPASDFGREGTRDFFDIVHPDDVAAIKQDMEAALQVRQPFTLEYRMLHADGSIRWVWERGQGAFSGEQLLWVDGVILDLTDRKQIEEALRHSEERLRLSLEFTQITVWEWYPTTGKIFFTGSGAHLLNVTDVGETHYEVWRDRVHPKDIDRVEQALATALSTQTDYDAEYRICWQDGSVHWLAAKGRGVYDATGQPLFMLGVLFEITERKQAEKQLRERDRRWHYLLENIPLAVVELDCTGKLEFANSFFLELTGYQSQEVLGQRWFTQFLPADHIAPAYARFQAKLQQSRHPQETQVLLTKTGEEKMIAWNSTQLRNSQGDIIGLIRIGEDVTQRQAIEQMKDEFISIVSHELRTPLTAIRGSLGLLATGALDDDPQAVQQMIQIAAIDTERLVRLVNDILDLERLSAGMAHQVPEWCQADELVQQAVKVMQPLVQAAQINLSIATVAMPIWVVPDQIIQTLTNLLSNAVKFSPPGTTITLTVQSQVDGLLFQIRDQGRGIPASKLETIFGRFQQIDASDSREKGGTGLGLAICRTIIQQHKGQIWAESVVGEGSTFSFTIPHLPVPN